MRILLLPALIFSVTAAIAAPPHDYYVALNGDDGNPGTLEAPFATVHRARNAVRERIAAGPDSDITVYIRGGMYYMAEPLLLGPEDSGSTAYKVSYRAYEDETPVLSGGREITDWTPDEDGRWRATLPDVASGAWYFRQLFRENDRLPRGRFPDNDRMLRVVAVDESVTEITLSEALPDIDFAAGDAELVVYQNWSITRTPIVSGDGATVRLSHPSGWIGHGAMTTTSPGKPCYIEHARNLVATPGEWHLDRRQGVLTYQAEADEDPNATRFVAPRLERLLVAQGTEDNPVRNLHFIGITFIHAEWPLPEFGYAGIQAGHHGTQMDVPTHVLPGAVAFRFAEACGLESCRIAHVGASGVVLGGGCHDNAIIGCTFEDIGGNGVMFGWRGDDLPQWKNLVGDYSLSADWLNPRHVPRNNTLHDSTLQRCAAVNHGCVAVYDGFCDGTRITRNLVYDMPYTGISIGFRWDEAETSQRNGLVEHNHVHDVMKVLADGGAIYTLGYQPGTVLRGNLLHDVHRSELAHGGAPNNGIFFDQGSKGYLVEENIIYNTSGDPIRFNQTGPDNMTFLNNAFGISPDHPDFPGTAAAGIRKN